MKTKVSEKGQITIPKAVRERLGIRPGQVLEVREEGGRVVARKVAAADPLEHVTGILKLHRPADKLIAELRGDPDAV